MAADCGYASKDNVQQAKDKSVKDLSFLKKKRLKVEQVTKMEAYVYP